MRQIQTFNLLLLMLIVASCTNKHDTLIRDFSFENKGLQVITMMANEKTNTIALLFGNDLAVKNKLASYPTYKGKEIFKLVTWRLQPNTFWYGSKINGTLLCIETVEITLQKEHVIATYTRVSCDDTVVGNEPMNKAKRIRFILSQQAAVFL